MFAKPVGDRLGQFAVGEIFIGATGVGVGGAAAAFARNGRRERWIGHCSDEIERAGLEIGRIRDWEAVDEDECVLVCVCV